MQLKSNNITHTHRITYNKLQAVYLEDKVNSLCQTQKVGLLFNYSYKQTAAAK